MITKQEIMRIAMRQSAVDCSCSEEDFRRTTHVVVESRPAGEASRYMTLPHLCTLFSYGSNIVASCRRDLMKEVEAYINGADRIHTCFEPPYLYDLNRILEKAGARVSWMHTGFVPDPEQIFGADLHCEYETREMYPEDFRDLYVPEWSNGRPKWSNALSHERRKLDMMGVGAFDGEKLIGLAGCSADCPEMWQIGIDVLPEYRQKGIASAMTNQLARAVFREGKIPFYAATWSNVRSFRNGLRSGFRPAWAVMTAKEY